MILVAGGTGLLGSRVANRLAARGLEVRVLSRGLAPDPGRLDDRVSVVRGDVRFPSSLVPAMDGVELVVSAVQGFAGPDGVTPDTVDRQGNANLITAAEQFGAEMVLASIVGASPDSPMELFRAKYAAEQTLERSSIPWTIVRSDAYAQAWIGILEQTAGRSGRPVVFGSGDNPIRFVDVEEVADLVTRAVVDPSLRGRTLEICGPEAVTLSELGALVMRRNGAEGAPRRVPRPLLRVMAATVGRLKPALGRQARSALAMDRLPQSDDRTTRAEFPDLPRTPVSEVVRRTGRPSRHS